MQQERVKPALVVVLFFELVVGRHRAFSPLFFGFLLSLLSSLLLSHRVLRGHAAAQQYVIACMHEVAGLLGRCADG